MEEDGVRHNVEIEVNHPARVGSWRVYQVGYDTSKGRWSDTSVLECIRDPWYGAAHVALWLLLVAGVVMFITAGGRRTGAKKTVCAAGDAAVGADDMSAAGRNDGAAGHGSAAGRRRGRRKEVKR